MSQAKKDRLPQAGMHPQAETNVKYHNSLGRYCPMGSYFNLTWQLPESFEVMQS